MLRNILLIVGLVILLLVVLFVWGVFEVGEEAIDATQPDVEVEGVETE